MSGTAISRTGLRTELREETSPSDQIGGQFDRALKRFRKTLPGCGLKLVLYPPLPGGSAGQVSVSAWCRGDVSARVHSGGSAREAMGLLLESEATAGSQRRIRDGCTRCRGGGWYMASPGIRVICTHSPES
jgi:hypothetical protein